MIENWADNLITEYTAGRKALHAMKDRYDENDPYQKQELSQINSMIDSMTYAMEWMETGREPGTFRGVEKTRQYQRQFFESMVTVPDVLEQIVEELDFEDRKLHLAREDKLVLADVFASMSHRERQCYVLYYGNRMSMGKIADEVGISKRTVQQYIERARQKVKDIVV